MSILADLLSKNKWAASQVGKDIPPTLARAQVASAKKRTPKKRYIVVAVVSVAIVAVGLAMTSMWGRLIAPKAVKYPLPPQVASSVAPPRPAVAPPPPQPPQQQAASPAAPLPAAEPHGKARATFETRHLPKSVAVRHGHPKPRQVTDSMTVQKQLASRELQKLATKRTEAGAETHREAVSPPKIDTETRSAFLYAARSAEQAGDWRLALANYRRALEIDPENYKIMSNAAAALNNLGMFEEGAREARQALARKPGYIPAMINAAIAYSSKGNNREALRLFSDACAADPENRSLAINLGILQERMGKLDEARATYRGLAAAGDPLALMGLGRICERKGDRAGAAGDYRRIMALRDVSPAIKKEARDNLARLEN